MQLFFPRGEYLHQLLYTIRLKNAVHVRIRIKAVNYTQRRLCFDFTPIECPYPYTIEVKCAFRDQPLVETEDTYTETKPKPSAMKKRKMANTLDEAFQRAHKQHKSSSSEASSETSSEKVSQSATTAAATNQTTTATAAATETTTTTTTDPVRTLLDQNSPTESYSLRLQPLLVQLEDSSTAKESAVMLETTTNDEWVWMRAADKSFQVRVRKYESSDEASVCNPPKSPQWIQCFCPVGLSFVKSIVKTAYKQGAQWIRLQVEHVQNTRKAVVLFKYRDDTIHAVDAEQRMDVVDSSVICRDEETMQALQNGHGENDHGSTNDSKARVVECSFVVHVPQLNNILESISSGFVDAQKGGAYFVLDRSQAYDVFLIYRRTIRQDTPSSSLENLRAWTKQIDVQGHAQIQLPGYDCVTV
jgi:hypothetical protein